MKTLTTRVIARSIAAAVTAACMSSVPAYAQDAASGPHAASKQENIGVATGVAVGAVAGGPFGAIVGAAAGAWLGERYHRQANARSALAADLSTSEGERSRLVQNVTQLNGLLVSEQERGEQLELALSHADEVETLVSFRTNEDLIQPAALAPLQKLGELAAALADARVRVAGYADRRGSDSVNDALSRRRAEAVAAVLASAGVGPDRLIVEAHGKSAATSNEGDFDGYALDRRVIVKIERAGQDAVARNRSGQEAVANNRSGQEAAEQ